MARSQMQPATIHYRRLEDLTGVFKGTTLQTAVRRALSKKKYPSGVALKDDFHLRVFERPSDGDNLFANDVHFGGPYAFGDLVHFTSGHMQALFQQIKKAVPQAPIKQMKAEDGEFIHSLLYWYLRGDHVFVLQARTARTSDLERYFSWLLSEATDVIPKPLNVLLRSKFDPSAVGGDLSEIEEIKIGGSLAPRAAEEEQPVRTRVVEEERTVEDIEKATGRNTVIRVLEAVLGPDTAAVDTFIKKIDPAAELKLRVTIGMKARRTKIDRAPLKELELGLRNLPDAEISVRGKGGKTTPLGELQLTYPTRIAMKASLWEPESVLDAFERAYKEFVASGKIDGETD